MTSAGGVVFRQGREVAQIRIEQRGLNGLAEIAPQRRRQHPLRAALAEIGIERRAQRGARGEYGKRRRGETRSLAQLLDLVCGERTRPDPAELRPILSPDHLFVHLAARDVAQPAAAGIIGRVGRQPTWCEAERLDDPAVLRAPQPGPLRDQRMRHLQRQAACRKRHTVGDQMSAEFREQTVGPGAVRGGIDEPGEGPGELHGPMMAKVARLCHGQSLTHRSTAAMWPVSAQG
ncbi:hypothetical protein ACVW0J_001139 [Bradyrhizobium sp. i1.7.7]